MRKTFLFVLLTILLLRPVLAEPVADADTSREFSKLIARYYAAWNTFDINKAGEFYAKDADLVFFDVAPLKYQGWAEYGAGAKKTFLDRLQNGKLTSRDDLRVTRRGNVAWTTDTFHLEGTFKDGQKLDLEVRHTAVWEKRGGRWLIVHEHCSAPAP